MSKANYFKQLHFTVFAYVGPFWLWSTGPIIYMYCLISVHFHYCFTLPIIRTVLKKVYHTDNFYYCTALSIIRKNQACNIYKYWSYGRNLRAHRLDTLARNWTNDFPLLFWTLVKNFMDPLEVVKKQWVPKIGVFCPLFCLGMLGKSTSNITGT